MHLKTNCYTVNTKLEGAFMDAISYEQVGRARELARKLLDSIYTGEVSPRIVDDETVKLWEERSRWWLEEGRKQGYGD